MKSATESSPKAYATPREWLEGKRRFVEVLRKFCGGGDDCRRRDAPSGVEREVLQAALSWHEAQHERRVELTREAGTKLPIDDFVAEFELDEVEREVVELVLVVATDLSHDDGRGLGVAEVVRLLSRGQAGETQRYLDYFLPGSHLASVINCRDGYSGKRLSIEDDVVGLLAGVDSQSARQRAKKAAESWHGDIAEFLAESGVVLGTSTLDSIRPLWGLVRREEIINSKWGFGTLEHVPTGVCVLFHGPSGTGKTLTAKCLCRALGRQPFIVSYPDLLSKWVGDTEKSTKAVFAEATQTGKVLVFDEADAVFAQRTDVRSATDRYANGEVNTLLMELERFPGIVVLTTNHADVFDPALERRIRYKVHFSPPGAAARAAIWREHLPHEAPVAQDADFDRLAAEFELTGGQIANAVMTAASLAASRINGDDDTTEITMTDFRRAAEAEKRGFGSAAGNRPMGFN
jgi:hypothetical protein